VISLLAAGYASAEVIYGPKVLKLSGSSKQITNSFGAQAGRAAWVEVINGFEGTRMANAVIIVLNGNRVIKKKHVNKNIRSAKVPVILRTNNTIKIIVRGSKAIVTVRVLSRAADFSRLVGYGDSLLAAFIDGSLVETNQVWGFGSQIAKQAGTSFILPLITEPGIPPRIKVENGQPVLPDPNEQMGYRKNPNQKPDNLAVPGATVWSSLNVSSIGGKYKPYELVLGGKRPMIGELKRRKPTFVLLWIGSNDVLDMVLNTDLSDHTALNEFKKNYEKMLKTIQKTGASVVAAHLPDVTTVAILVSPPTLLQQLAGVPANALVLITDVANFNMGPNDYLTPDEVNQIRETIQSFNSVIAKLCEKYGVPLVDAYAFTQRWKNSGVMVAGQHLTTQWLHGGIFSLDGIHPSITGHALVANEFISVINSAYGANLASVNVASVLSQDPNRPSGIASDGNADISGETGFLKQAIRILKSTETARKLRRR